MKSKSVKKRAAIILWELAIEDNMDEVIDEIVCYIVDNPGFSINDVIAHYERYGNYSGIVSLIRELSPRIFKVTIEDLFIQVYNDSHEYLDEPDLSSIDTNDLFKELCKRVCD